MCTSPFTIAASEAPLNQCRPSFSSCTSQTFDMQPCIRFASVFQSSGKSVASCFFARSSRNSKRMSSSSASSVSAKSSYSARAMCDPQLSIFLAFSMASPSTSISAFVLYIASVARTVPMIPSRSISGSAQWCPTRQATPWRSSTAATS